MNQGLVVAAAVVGGAALGVLSSVAPSDALAAGLGLGACALLVTRRRVSVACGLAALAGLSAAHAAHVRDAALAPSLTQWFDAQPDAGDRLDEPVVLSGRILADASHGDFGVQLSIDVARVQDRAGWHDAAGVVRASVSGSLVDERFEAWTKGRVVRAPVLLRRPRVTLNPGGLSARLQALRRPYDLAGTIKSAALVEVAPGAWWADAGAAARRWVRRAAATHIAPLDAQSAAIVTAILIGDRAGLDTEVVERLQAAGTYHVIAISGGNVALVTAACVLLFRLVIRSARINACCAIAVVIAYGWVVGGDASVTRAVTAAVVYLSVGLAGLVPRPMPVIAMVALLVAWADPLVVIDVAAWLSFGATIGIVLGAGRLQQALGVRRDGERGIAARLGLAALTIGCATLAAELALLPVAATVFSRVGVAGLVVNLVAVPAMALVQAAGALTVACAVLSDTAAAGAGRAAHLAAVVLVDSARLVDVWPGLSWRVPPVAGGWLAAYYGGWLVWLGVGGHRRVRRLALAVVVVSGLVCASGPGVGLARPGPGVLRVTAIDVGQGDAILVQFPGGRSMLVDAGGAGPQYDIAARVVVPAVWASGERHVDWFVVSHGDRDHIGGALGVLKDLRPAEIWEGVPVPADPALAALRLAARRDDVVWRTMQAGHRVDIGDVHLDVLHPERPDWERPRVRNDDSLVLRLSYGVVEVLLTGDAAGDFEHSGPATSLARLRVLKVAHHGSRSSSAASWVAAYGPAIALISAGRGNLFGHPAPEVVERFDQAHAEIFRTDRDGAIRLETDGRRIHMTTATGRSRWVAVFR